jgi:S-adenosylmethionine synthetase
MHNNYFFTSESVTEGHPDKICDQISDSILDRCLIDDPESKVAADVLVKTELIVLTGEITTKANISEKDLTDLARKIVKEIGYVGIEGFSFDTCRVQCEIGQQATDIAGGVFKDDGQIGAGDQGIMFGYACNETPEMMPMPIIASHHMTQGLSKLRKTGVHDYLLPDGKSQVTIAYDDKGKPVKVDTVVISTHHAAEIDRTSDNDKIQKKIKSDLWDSLILSVCHSLDIEPPEMEKFYCNPSGKFTIGGPQGDSGLTGRKIIVDTYGGYSRHGGGAFSGKDPTKVDRSAAYAARHLAKNIVAAGLAEKCEVQVSYAIGRVEPTSIFVETFGTSQLSNIQIQSLVENRDLFDLRPAAIIKTFNLRNLPKERGGFYQKVAAYGHFGRPELDLPWERLDQVEALKQAAGRM